jgi:hypothetical protein
MGQGGPRREGEGLEEEERVRLARGVAGSDTSETAGEVVPPLVGGRGGRE